MTGVMVTEPFDPPLQETLVKLFVADTAGGFDRVSVLMAEQPLASVTVTV